MISTLKIRNVPQREIERILILKGHPRLYIKTIINIYEEMYK